MIDELRAMAVFAKTVEAGSFRGAAEMLQLSPSVVSHHISQLEQRLGVALLYRSTRKISLTDAGRQLFDASRSMLAAAEQGLNTIAHTATEPAGKLSLTLPGSLTRSPLTQAVAAFAKAFPRISLFINYSDFPQDLIRDGIDLAIRIGPLRDSTLKAKKLFEIDRILVASPDYVAQQTKPRKPGDLNNWDWIGLSMRPNRKVFTRTKEEVTVEFVPRISTDSIEAVCQLAMAGMGLATPPSFMVAEEIEKGRLVEVLPRWKTDSLGVHALWPANAPRESLTFKLIRFLETFPLTGRYP